MRGLGPLVGDSVGLFGAIEVGFHHGPMLMNRDYRIETAVVCVGQSPQTEYIWYDMAAFNTNNQLVTTLRMQSRAMKASSPLYRQAAN